MLVNKTNRTVINFIWHVNYFLNDTFWQEFFVFFTFLKSTRQIFLLTFYVS